MIAFDLFFIDLLQKLKLSNSLLGFEFDPIYFLFKSFQYISVHESLINKESLNLAVLSFEVLDLFLVRLDLLMELYYSVLVGQIEILIRGSQ